MWKSTWKQSGMDVEKLAKLDIRMYYLLEVFLRAYAPENITAYGVF
jgi:hypothetical protein